MAALRSSPRQPNITKPGLRRFSTPRNLGFPSLAGVRTLPDFRFTELFEPSSGASRAPVCAGGPDPPSRHRGCPGSCRTPTRSGRGPLGPSLSAPPLPASDALAPAANDLSFPALAGIHDPVFGIAAVRALHVGGSTAWAAYQRVAKPTRHSNGDASRLNRAAARPSSLRFGRNTPGIPPSRALSAGPPPGGLAPPGELGLAALGAHVGFTTDW